MGLRAIDAVQKRSQYSADNADNFIPYKIMLAIAWYAGDNGRAGTPNEPKQCPSFNALAERANVHRNTINKYLPLLIESGEITVDQYGRGRGRHNVYTINLSVDQSLDIGTQLERERVPIITRSHEVLVHEAKQLAPLLVQEIGLLVHGGDLLVHDTAVIGTRSEREHVTESIDPIDPIESEEKIGSFIAPPEPVKLYENGELLTLWGDVLGEIRLQMTESTFNKWLARASLAQVTSGENGELVAVIETPNSYGADWINGRLSSTIKRTLDAITGQRFTVHARAALLHKNGLAPVEEEMIGEM